MNARAGASPEFAYSEAMKAPGIVWNERSLAAFLRDPGKLAPGTKMRFRGIGGDKEIKALQALSAHLPAGASTAPC